MRLRVLIISMALAAAAVAALPDGASTMPAARKTPKPVTTSADLWATINVCDTPAHPDTIGIRGSMPALGRRAILMMRFQVLYWSKADGKWRTSDSGADSGWKKLGTVRRGTLESGQNFTFRAPTDGSAHRLRGAVRFKWVWRGKVLERARELTEAGHRSTAGADPVGYSAAICEIS